MPPGLGTLSLLSWLNLSFNSLTSLPLELSGLTQLRHLDLSHNQLAGLPAW